MSALEQSVTLDDVFAVVNAKRVPLAPELAGYLTLEIAEGAQGSEGEVDPKTVFIGEEGSVALVRPKKDNAPGNAETSVRLILSRLLEASGSQTPALGAAARRKTISGLHVLVEELEAALIPVNRAAGRRALARLAREVKRVTLGVGRNASVPHARAEREPGSSSSSSPPAPEREPSAPGTAPLPARASRPERDSARPGTPLTTPLNRREAPEAFPDLEMLPRGAASRAPAALAPPSPTTPDGAAAGVERATASSAAPIEKSSGPDEVDNLLAEFEVSGNTTDRAVSRELKAMVGLDPTPPPPTAPRDRTSADHEVEDLLARSEQSVPIANAPRPPGAASSPSIAPRAPAVASDRAALPPPADRHNQPVTNARIAPPPPGLPAFDAAPAVREFKQPRAPRVDRILTVLTLLVLLGGAAAVWTLKPGFFTGRTPERIEAERKALASAQAKAVEQPPVRCRGALVITDVPPRAEVLVRQGQAPVDVERMPIGTRLEFVATAEGFAPRRTVVPTGATWDNGPDGKPRFEVAVQLDPSKTKPGPSAITLGEAWPVGEPGTQVGGSGPPGTVHIVSTPRGAEVWLLVGAAPTATIDPIRCDSDTDILIAGPTTLRKRLHVTAADVKAAPQAETQGSSAGSHVVKLSAK